MATIQHPQLAVHTDPIENRARVVAICDVEFTDFEINAMNRLGLRYSVACRVLNRDLWYEDAVVAYDLQELPRTTRGATRVEHVMFESDAVMSELHEHAFTRDELVAEFTLTNLQTNGRETLRSDVVSVNLV